MENLVDGQSRKTLHERVGAAGVVYISSAAQTGKTSLIV